MGTEAGLPPSGALGWGWGRQIPARAPWWGRCGDDASHAGLGRGQGLGGDGNIWAVGMGPRGVSCPVLGSIGLRPPLSRHWGPRPTAWSP